MINVPSVLTNMRRPIDACNLRLLIVETIFFYLQWVLGAYITAFDSSSIHKMYHKLIPKDKIGLTIKGKKNHLLKHYSLPLVLFKTQNYFKSLEPEKE